MSREVNVKNEELPNDNQTKKEHINMNERRRRSQNFSYNEKVKLVKIVSMYRGIILSKNMDGATNEAKSGAWNLITARFNRSRSDQRPKITLMRLWHKIKTEAKIYKTMRNSRLKNPGRSLSKIKRDPLLLRVCEIMECGCADSTEANEETNNASTPEQSDQEADDLELPEIVFSNDDLEIDSTDHTTTENNTNDKAHDEHTNTKTDHNDTIANKDTPDRRCSGPLWPRKRMPFSNVGSEAAASFYKKVNNYEEASNKRMSIQEIKYQILNEELEFKRNLYKLQLESAAKEVEIKKEVLANIKSRKLAPQSHTLSEPP